MKFVGTWHCSRCDETLNLGESCTCVAHLVNREGRPPHGSLEDCKSRFGGPSSRYEMGNLPINPPTANDLLIQSLDRQSKAIEEYTKATHNLTTHIALLIQAMADAEDSTGDGIDMRTLG